MASQTGKQIITIYILFNISWGKSNQPIDSKAKNEKTSWEKESGRLVFVFSKCFI